MSDNLRHVGPSFLKLQEDMERIRLTVRPSYLDFCEQIERILRPIRQHHLEIVRMTALSGLATARIAEIVKANDHWHGMFDQITASSRPLVDLGRLHETWTKSLKPMQDQITQLQAATKLSLGGIAYRLTVCERILARLDFDAIRRAVAVPEPSILKLRESIMGMTATYGRLAASIHSYPDIHQLPDFALPGATRELFVASHVIGVLPVVEETDEDQEAVEAQLITDIETESSVCIDLLQALDPVLATPYRGAHEALRTGNPDRARHILTSLRELWNHLLRRIAPDEDVLSWLPGNDKKLLHDGRPTRKARILYICRHLSHGPLTDFIDKDTRALITFMDLLNRIHEPQLGLTDQQLRALLLRTDSWLTYILQISEAT